MKGPQTPLKLKPKCKHKQSESPSKPKSKNRIMTQCNQLSPKNHYHPVSKNLKTNNQNHNYELCKQATLCYYGLKQVLRMQALQKQSKKLHEENKKLRHEKQIYDQYFKEFEGRFNDQKLQIKKLREQNAYLKAKFAKMQQLNSTLSGATVSGKTSSFKDFYTARSMPKYLA